MILDPLLLIPVLVAALVVGLWLCIGAVWTKRQGQTPYCKACGYNLSGIEARRCPECGRALGSKAIVIGERTVRRKLLVAGVVCTLTGLLSLAAIGIGAALRVDWYDHLPTVCLLLLTEHGSDLQADKAMGELRGRVYGGELSAKNITRLIKLHGREQAKTDSRWRIVAGTGAVLDELHELGALNEEHVKLILDQLEGKIDAFVLRVRPRITHGSRCPVALVGKDSLVADLFVGTWHYRIQLNNLSVDGVSVLPAHYEASILGVLPLYMFRALTWLVPVGGPGDHEIAGEISVRVMERDTVRKRPKEVRRSARRLVAPVTVLPESAPSPVKLRRSPDLDEAVAEKIRLQGFDVSRTWYLFGDRVLEGWIVFEGDRPIDLALEAVAEVAGQELMLGSSGFPRLAACSRGWWSGRKAAPSTNCTPGPGATALNVAPSGTKCGSSCRTWLRRRSAWSLEAASASPRRRWTCSKSGAANCVSTTSWPGSTEQHQFLSSVRTAERPGERRLSRRAAGADDSTSGARADSHGPPGVRPDRQDPSAGDRGTAARGTGLGGLAVSGRPRHDQRHGRRRRLRRRVAWRDQHRPDIAGRPAGGSQAGRRKRSAVIRLRLWGRSREETCQ